MSEPTTDQDIAKVKCMIAALPPDSQRRVEVIANILRDLLAADVSGEVELAFTLVLAEIAS